MTGLSVGEEFGGEQSYLKGNLRKFLMLVRGMNALSSPLMSLQ